jgi:hypothetical protein
LEIGASGLFIVQNWFADFRKGLAELFMQLFPGTRKT